MVKKIFYNSSLPKSGSTLLQNILMQNPEIYSTPTSGLLSLVLASRKIYTTNDAFKAQDEEQMKKAIQGFCKEGMYGYFNNLTNLPYVIDKNRGWLGNYRFLNFIESNPKVIVMVRDLRSIFSSLEKTYRNNPHKDVGIIDSNKLINMNTKSRMQHFSVSPPLGPSLEWLYDAHTQGYDSNFLYIKYENFMLYPEQTLNIIYEYLGIKPYEHNFNNIPQLTFENDVIHGIFGDHKIKNKLTPAKEDYLEILGAENCNLITNNYSWYYKKFQYY
jgi:sulfotransferase